MSFESSFETRKSSLEFPETSTFNISPKKNFEKQFISREKLQ